MTEQIHPKTSGKRTRFDVPLSFGLAVLMFGQLLWLIIRSDLLEVLIGAVILTVVFLSMPRFGVREFYLLSVSSTLAVVVWLTSDAPLAAIAEAVRQATFLMSFLLLVGLIQQAASTSRDVQECGYYLTNQPPGRRFLAIFGGTHVMSHVFNLGIISLIAPLIMRGTENTSDPRNPIRRRRQISAMLNGFAWGVIWSPTAIAPLALMVLLPGIERIPWMIAGLLIAMVILAVGWCEDRARWRPRRRMADVDAPPFPAAAFLGFGVLCLALLVLTLGGMVIFDQSVVFGLMFAAPIILVGWLMLQTSGDVAATTARVAGIYRNFLPHSAPIGVSLAGSGFIGRIAANLTPSELIASHLNIMSMPGWAFMLGLSLFVLGMSWFALSPIMLAVFLGAVLADLPALPVSSTWAALAVSCGWALSMMTSPFATTVLMNTQITGIPGLTYSGWNWRFAALAVAVLTAAFWVIDTFFP